MKVRYEAKVHEIPAEGVYWADLLEIKELGMVETPNGEREKVLFTWGLDETDSRGRPFLVFQRFNLSLHPASYLSNAIYDLTGSEPGEEYELDDLLNTRCQLVLKHNQSETNGRTYANVVTILRSKTAAEEKEEKRIAAATARVKQQATAHPPKVTATARVDVADVRDDDTEITDNDVPF